MQPIPSLPDIAPMKQDTILEAKTHTQMCKAKKFKRKERRHGKRDCKWALCRIESIDRARETMVLVVTGSMNVFACNLVIVIFLVFAVFIVFDLFVIFVVFVVFAWG